MRRMAMLLMVMLVTMSATAAQPLLARNQHSTINNRQSFDLQAAIAAAQGRRHDRQCPAAPTPARS